MELDPYIVETLMPDLVGHDRSPASFLVYLLLEHRSGKSSHGWTTITLGDLANGTGLSKRSVQAAIKRLVRRELVTVRRPSITSVGEYRVERPWLRRQRNDLKRSALPSSGSPSS